MNLILKSDLQERQILFDVAKGVGILLVIWGHTACPFMDEIYAFHMPFFFMVSGFFFRRKENFKAQISYNIKRIGIPYLLFSILIYLYYRVFCLVFKLDFDHSAIDIINIIPYNNLVFQTLWFLVALFIIATFYYYFSKIKNGYLLFALCLLLHFVSSISISTLPNPFFILTAMGSLFYYYVGNKIYEKYKEIFTSSRFLLKIVYFLLSVSFYVLSFKANKFVDNEYLSILISLLTAFSGAFSLIYFSSFLLRIKYISTALSYIGRNSLCIYVLHYPLLEFTNPVSSLFFVRDTYLWGGVNVFLNLLVTIVATEILYRIFPKMLGKKIENNK